MCLVCNFSLVYCDSKSRIKSQGKHLEDMRLFPYSWTVSSRGLPSQDPREDSTQLYRNTTNYVKNLVGKTKNVTSAVTIIVILIYFI